MDHLAPASQGLQAQALKDKMVDPASIESSIRAGLACTHCEVRGDGAHFEAVIVSPAFAGLNRVRQHQLVYGALGERMR